MWVRATFVIIYYTVVVVGSILSCLAVSCRVVLTNDWCRIPCLDIWCMFWCMFWCSFFRCQCWWALTSSDWYLWGWRLHQTECGVWAIFQSKILFFLCSCALYATDALLLSPVTHQLHLTSYIYIYFRMLHPTYQHLPTCLTTPSAFMFILVVPLILIYAIFRTHCLSRHGRNNLLRNLTITYKRILFIAQLWDQFSSNSTASWIWYASTL